MNEDKNAPKQEEDLPPLTREDVYLTMAMIQQSVKQCAPFYSWAILNMVPHVTRDLPTAGVSYIDGRFHIFYNPEFMFKCLEDKGTNGVADVVRHEVMHLMHDHLHDDRIPSLARIPEEVKGWDGFIRDDVSADVAAKSRRSKQYFKLWNIACDLAINHYLPHLPEFCCFPGKGEFADMPPAESAEFYWNQLLKKYQQKIEEDNESFAEWLKDMGSMDSHGQGEQEGDVYSPDRSMADATLKDILSDAKAKTEADANGWGSMSEAERKMINDTIMPQIKWNAIVKRFIGYTIRMNKSTSWRKVNKRMPGLKPGRKKSYGAHIMIAVDMSGSVSDADLEAFSAEMNSLAKNTQFTVMPFDTEVVEDASYVWRKGQKMQIERVRCGGTCFQCVTDYVNQNRKKENIDGLIILSDLEAPKPGPCKVRRMWVQTHNGHNNFNPSEELGEAWVKLDKPIKK